MRISDWSSDVCSSDLLCKEGKGHAPRFACLIHNWTYDREGKLVGISGKDKFGAEVGEDLGLTELPAIEAAGVIWGRHAFRRCSPRPTWPRAASGSLANCWLRSAAIGWSRRPHNGGRRRSRRWSRR